MPKYLKTKEGSLEQAVLEAVSPAQQAAIAISKKEKGEKPKDEKDEKLVSEKKANFIRLSFNNPADVKKAKKWMDANLPGADQGFTGMDASGKDIEFEGVDDAEKLMSQLKKSGLKFKVDHRESVSETNKNDKSDDGEGLDAVQPKAVKKKFADRKDKDIDNDGDVDSSDKFLHKRRKAVSKSMKEDTVADAVRSMWEAAAKKADAKTEEEDEDEKPSKDSKGDTTMTGKPMSKVEVAVKEKG